MVCFAQLDYWRDQLFRKKCLIINQLKQYTDGGSLDLRDELNTTKNQILRQISSIRGDKWPSMRM